jgi:arylsulfatase A-like enzyme
MCINSRIKKNKGRFKTPILLLASALGVSSIVSAINQKETIKKDKRAPNIIVILADDLGYGDLSCYGATKISTPAIDKLASDGIRFTNAYASSSLSSPSRYNLLTGRYAWRTRLEFGVLKNYERPLIEKGETTIASFLKRNGYFTACVGKWHLGLDWALNSSAPDNPQENVFNSGKNNLQEFIDFSKPVTGGPIELGFDYFYGMSGSNNMQPYVFIENDRVLQPPSIEQTIDYDFYSNAKRAPDWDIKTVNMVLTNKAVSVIDNHFKNKKDTPLFLYFPTSAIHRPCLPTFTKGMSRAGLRGDIVVELDWTVGEVIKALKKNGVYENTLIVFTSDNGPRPGDPAVWIERYKKGGYEEYQEYFGDYNPEYINENGNMIWKGGWLTYSHSPSGELLGFKQDPSEGGIRVPFIFHWPNRVKSSSTNSNLICVGDLLATFSELLGDNLKENEGVDSYSFLPYLTNSASPEMRKSLVIASGSSGALIAIKDGWKYIEPAQPGRWPETYYEGGPGDKQPRLFNLKKDISELNDLFSTNPKKGQELIDLIKEVKYGVKVEIKK